MKTFHADLILDAGAELGEGPIWDSKTESFLWVDISKKYLNFFHPGSNKERLIKLPHSIGCVAVRCKGGVILALKNQIALLDINDETLEVLAEPEEDKTGHRFNDGKCDPLGRFWVGGYTHDWSLPATERLYCLDTDSSCRVMLTGITCSNGITWSLDKRTMYYIDSYKQEVEAFDYDFYSGEICNRRSIIQIPPKTGTPDGMTIDQEGMLWTALWGGSRIIRWNPVSAEILACVELPVTQVTSCTFGGKNLDELYITSARIDLSEADLNQQPLAGGLFICKVGVCGLPAFEFNG